MANENQEIFVCPECKSINYSIDFLTLVDKTLLARIKCSDCEKISTHLFEVKKTIEYNEKD